jgi:C2H2-type zinc finger
MAEPAPEKPTEQQPDSYVCPECGRSFSRPQALGAHRRRAHGVAGTSRAPADKKQPKAARAPKSGSSSRARRRSTRRGSPSRSRGSTTTQPTGMDRDRLLEALFPGGIPPREDVIRAVNAWLDDAERLRTMR